ncbi:TetR/AcrR family transcriptional regulator [Catenulispora pinisilvae]|uniref:TetR/AcrR family transcriptional regulator n=1 Tax=Catenulispora pinisilvae TaxID=2705253 RepID=UPI0018925B55|nr:TetR/AcrR family transcriptional regulator [Catenulispora pinisilvae]
MKASAATSQPASGAAGGRRRRATLSREAIIEAALSVGSSEGGSALTFSRLGKELGADPTAVYRHFRDKDELVLALTNRMVEESVKRVQGVDPARVGWREWLRRVASSVRAVYLERPAVAVLAATRTTATPAETASVERLIAVLHHAGLGVVEAAEIYRGLLDLTLGMTQATAAFALLPAEVQEQDVKAWTVTYAMLPESEFPHVRQSVPRLAELNRDDDAVFELVLDTFLDGVQARIDRLGAAGR